MNSTMKWIIGLVIVAVIAWFGYASLNKTEEAPVDETAVEVPVTDMATDGAAVDTTAGAVDTTTEVAQ